jgi:maltooligosyltrehalose synthase
MVLVVAVPRLVYRLSRGGDAPDWGATALPLPHEGPWRDTLTGQRHETARIAAADLFAGFPVAVLLAGSV